MADRSITVEGTSYGREGVSVTFDGHELSGDPFVADIVENRVKIGWRVDVAGVVSGPATLDLDEPLLTRATLTGAFDEVTAVHLVGVKIDDDAPGDADL